MLRLADISVRYGTVTALEAIDLTVARGEHLAVLGPSGSGKSTLLRAIAGLERPYGGTVSWEGHDVSALPVHVRGFGLMFQDYALFPHRDVAGNVGFALEMADAPPAARRQRVDEMLELVGLAGYGRRRVTELSGGEQQRVALARALAPRPRLLMLDEPLGALDRTLRERLLGELSEIFHALELTIIYVTHDQEEALAIGDRVAVLRAGRLEAMASPQELWRRPPTEFIARFLGLNNVVDATVDGGTAATPWGEVPVPAGTSSGPHRLVLRPEEIAIDSAGSICGTVESSTFRGSRTVVIVAVDDAPAIEIHAPPASPAPAVGHHVCLDIPLAAVFVLPERRSDSLRS